MDSSKDVSTIYPSLDDTYNSVGTEFDSQPDSVGETIFASLKIIIGLVGMIGNFVVCIVVIRLKFQRIHVLITSQAVDDFLSSTVLVLLTLTDLYPITATSVTGLGYIYCFFWQSHMLLFLIFSASTFNLIAVSLERYVAVLHPIWYSQSFSNQKAVIFACLAWLLGPLMQIIFAILTTVGTKEGQCIYVYYYPHYRNLMSAIGVMLFLWEFFFPCIIMGYCFTRITIKLQQQSRRVGASELSTTSGRIRNALENLPGVESARQNQTQDNQQHSDTSSSSKRNRNVTVTLIIVFVVYVTCWSADHFLFLQYNLGGSIDFNGAFYGFALSMAMLNSACNPFIYALRYKQYRRELKMMCTQCNVC